MDPLILGSQSPRRKEILDRFSLPFKQVQSFFSEESVSFDSIGRNPAHFVQAVAKGKSDVLHHQYPASIILTADTIGFFKDRILCKPKDRRHAFEMLSELSGHWHKVYSAVIVRKGGEMYNDIVETFVLFHELTPEQIHFYLDSIRWDDKAAAYAIQDAGGLIVKRIEGCYYNVLGLPIYSVYKLLKKFDIDLWSYLK